MGDFAEAERLAVLAPGQRGNGLVGQIVLKVASACNLNCTYCYVYSGKDVDYRSRPGLISDEVLDLVALRMREHCLERPGLKIGVCLHGGEPLLLGRERFAAIVERLRRSAGPALGSLHVQTNATLIDAAWADLIKSLRVSISVRLDGPPEINDSARVDHMGRGSAARTVTGIRFLMAAGVPLSVLCVVSPGFSGAEAYRFLRGIGVKRMDFLLPDVSHDDFAARYSRFGPTPAADFLISALDAWLDEDDPSTEIRLFADMLKLAMGDDSASTDAFGGGPASYVIVETDGSIQANDALRVCAGDLNLTGLNVKLHAFDRLGEARSLAKDILTGRIGPPRHCRACPDFSVCGGGYLPHRYSSANLFDNPSVWCADIRKVFAHMRRRMAAAESP